MQRWLQKIIPLYSDLLSYSKSSFKSDFSAGITVGVMLVPQGLAYAYLAGLPPIYGLYAGLIPLVLYGVFGSSRHLSVGPVAVSALLVYAGIKELAEPLSTEFVELAILTAFLIGVMQLLLSLLRLGILVNFISHPVISGFTSAAAIIVAISQLKDILGIEIERQESTLNTAIELFKHLFDFKGITVTISLVALAILIAIRKYNRRIPGALIAVVLATLVSWWFNLEDKGIKVVGQVPSGLPIFKTFSFDLETVYALMPTVLTVTAISIVESLGIAKIYEGKSREYRVQNNQELFSLGIANALGAFFQSLPTSGSFSRTAVNFSAHSKTGVSSLLSALVVMLSLLFLTPLFRHLPIAVLASIILLAIKNLFDVKEAIRLWKVHKRDFTMLLVTFLGTLTLGIEIGVLLGFSLSIVTVLYRSSQPNITEMGYLDDVNYFRSIERYTELNRIKDHLIIRFDDQLYYGNANYFTDKIVHRFEKNPAKYLVLDASNIHDIDSTGLKALNEVIEYLEKNNCTFSICKITEPVEDVIQNSGVLKRKKYEIGVYSSIKDAVKTDVLKS